MASCTLADVRALDDTDPLRGYRERFILPPGLIYLDGNSLGALPTATAERVARTVREEWGGGLVRSWNTCDWVSSPFTLGAKLAPLMGAESDEVIVTDTTSVNIFKLVMAALELQPQRHTLLTELGNFPTDLYVCDGAVRAFGRSRKLHTVERQKLVDAIDDDTALLLLTHVHYKSGEVFDMQEITRLAHERGALVLWDLSHSVGAVSVQLNEAQADFAVGCGYKYLNGGPGAPAYLYVAKRHHELACNPISGWLGHLRPFAFVDGYEPAPGIGRFLSGTPSIIANCALDVGIELIREAGIDPIVQKSRQLGALFIDLVESTCGSHGLQLACPRSSELRGSHVSFAHPNGYEIMQALIAEDVIGDFRAPDVIRFGFNSLYTRFQDVWVAVERLRVILDEARWCKPHYKVRAAVT